MDVVDGFVASGHIMQRTARQRAPRHPPASARRAISRVSLLHLPFRVGNKVWMIGPSGGQIIQNFWMIGKAKNEIKTY